MNKVIHHSSNHCMTEAKAGGAEHLESTSGSVNGVINDVAFFSSSLKEVMHSEN